METKKLYFATEENAYEGEKIGEFSNETELLNTLRECLSDDVDCEKSVEENKETIDSLLEDYEDGYIEFTNSHGYDVVYIITEDDEEAKREFDALRREMIGAYDD